MNHVRGADLAFGVQICAVEEILEEIRGFDEEPISRRMVPEVARILR